MIVNTPVNLGDFALASTVKFMWGSQTAAGASVTRATNGTVSVYKNNDTTQSVSGVTDTEDFDGQTGLHYCAIDTSSDGTFYSTGGTFTVVLLGAVIDGLTMNVPLAVFTLGIGVNVTRWLATACATPTVAGVPEVDLTHVGGATTNVAALATNVDAILTDTGTTLQAELDGIQADMEDIQTRLPAALVGGRIDASVGAMASGVVTATAIATDALGALELAADAVAEIADAVWDEARSGHTTSGTFGESFSVIHSGSVTGAATNVSLIDSSLTASDTGHYIGRTVIFVTGSLANQATTINGFNATLDRITFTQLTGVPSASDRYIIV